MTGAPLTLGGTAVVVCIHDREKRKIVDLAYDPAREKAHVCWCCENLFTKNDDVPGLCPKCAGPAVFRGGGA